MIAAISPADYNYDESLGTLKYANRAKSIENIVVRNEDVNERMIRELKEQIEKLKAELLTGGGTSGPDPEVERKLKQMEEEQKSAWEEKERLSQALAAERQSNMNNVISTMMRDLKDQKIEHMKKIKLLTIEKGDLVKSQKTLKEKSDAIKGILDQKMGAYNTLKGLYEGCRPVEGDDEQTLATKKSKKSELAGEMQALLAEVETQKAKWIEKKDAMKVLRTRISQTEENIDSAKADLVVAHGLLDQNDKLRQKIHEEERKKAKDQIAKELGDARAKLDEERQAVRGSIEAEVAEEIAQIRRELEECQNKLSNAEEEKRGLFEQNEELREYSEKLETRLVDAEALHEAAQATIAGLREEVQEKELLAERISKSEEERTDLLRKFEQDIAALNSARQEELRARLAQQLTSSEEQKYLMFKSLMDSFADERRSLESKNKDIQKLLNQATKVLKPSALFPHPPPVRISSSWQNKMRICTSA
jgi:chromosome segregation ATPase